MNTSKRSLAMSAGLLATALPTSGSAAHAQDSDWQFVGSFYVFGADTTTSIGGVESELSFGDALENLDLAFMGTFEARRGKWSIIADYMLADLSFADDTLGPVFAGSETALRTQFLSGYLTYAVYDETGLAIDVGGGFRWFETDTPITVVGGPTPAPSVTSSDSWIDPLIALHLRYQITDRWSASASIDYGSFRSNGEAYQLIATAVYAINDSCSVRGGYRYLIVDHETDGVDFELSQSGSVLGVTHGF